MEKKTFMQKLKNMGPAAIITSAFEPMKLFL